MRTRSPQQANSTGPTRRLHCRLCPHLTVTTVLRTSYINNSLHLARKYARIFVRGHYLFREANSFPRAKLEENCELRGTDNVQGQISEHIFKAKLRLLCLLSFKYFSQQAGSASPSYVNTSKFVNWLPKPPHSIFIPRISNRLRFS